jgi:hypothetical protein
LSPPDDPLQPSNKSLRRRSQNAAPAGLRDACGKLARPAPICAAAGKDVLRWIKKRAENESARRLVRRGGALSEWAGGALDGPCSYFKVQIIGDDGGGLRPTGGSR